MNEYEDWWMTEDEIKYFLLVRSDKQTCIACPTQWEGKLNDGREFYFRYRWGYATLAVRDTLEDARGCADVGRTLGDGLDGYLENREYREAFVQLYSDLEMK